MDIPKQYILVHGEPIIIYSFRKFLAHPLIDSITFVIADQWKEFMRERIDQIDCMGKRILFASAGESRQHSVFSGLSALKSFAHETDKVLVHDAVRPLFPVSNIDDGIEACNQCDAALPVISVKDATYQSFDGISLSRILPRQELYSGQSPECFVYGKFLDAHAHFSGEEIARIRGCSELAFRSGLSVKLIKGLEQNFKITTIEDLKAFELTVSEE